MRCRSSFFRDAPKHGIGKEPRARMATGIGGILCGFADHFPTLVAEHFVDVLKPNYIDSAIAKFTGSQGSVPADIRFPASIVLILIAVGV